MSEFKSISVARVLGRTSLSGIAAGKAALAKLRAELPGVPQQVLLDFAEVELITASAFREAFLPIVAWAVQDGQSCILVNANRVVKEEASIAAEHRGVVLVFATFDEDGIGAAEAIGALEDKHALTLHIVLKAGEADAKVVSEESRDSAVTTVWNNRLVALHKMGLLKVRKVGKTKLYSPIVEGMSYGTGFHL